MKTGKVNFWSTMSKMKLNGKACSCKVIKMKTAVKVVELKEDRSLFARLVMICKNAPLPHRLTWSAIVAEWAPQTALLPW